MGTNHQERIDFYANALESLSGEEKTRIYDRVGKRFEPDHTGNHDLEWSLCWLSPARTSQA